MFIYYLSKITLIGTDNGINKVTHNEPYEDTVTTGKIAIPYYGNLTHPTSGFERIFFIVDQGGQKNMNSQQVSIGIWDAKESQLLPTWLHELGVQQIVCRTRPEGALVDTMVKSGIRVFSEGTEAARNLLKQLNII